MHCQYNSIPDTMKYKAPLSSSEMLQPAQHDRPQAPRTSAGTPVCHRVKAEKYRGVVKAIQHHVNDLLNLPNSIPKYSAQEVPHPSSGWCYFLWPRLLQKLWQTSGQGLRAQPWAAPPQQGRPEKTNIKQVIVTLETKQMMYSHIMYKYWKTEITQQYYKKAKTNIKAYELY